MGTARKALRRRRNAGLDAEALAGLCPDVEPPADGFDALAHGGQAVAGIGARLDSDSAELAARNLSSGSMMPVR
jgi:hypothetical protein